MLFANLVKIDQLQFRLLQLQLCLFRAFVLKLPSIDLWSFFLLQKIQQIEVVLALITWLDEFDMLFEDNSRNLQQT